MADFHSNGVESQPTQEKKCVVTERLQKRQDARQQELKKKRSENEESVSRQENVSTFLENLAQAREQIEDGIMNSVNIDKAKFVDHFDSLSDSLHKMQRYVAECTVFLPSYEVRQAQEIITNLQTKIQEKRDEVLPKKKFAFSKAKKTEKKPESCVKESSLIDDADAIVELAACKLVKQSGKTLVMKSMEINQKDVALVDLTNCIIKLYGAPSAIQVFNVKNCHILSGPVSGSVFIRSCNKSVFVLACQQLRVHNTLDSDFYIHVTSKAIIEDCSGVKFSPYNWIYNGLDEDYAVSGLDKSRNNWDKVDDFNWLAADAASPNWSVLEEKVRTPTWEDL